jgi:hypothetical protein
VEQPPPFKRNTFHENRSAKNRWQIARSCICLFNKLDLNNRITVVGKTKYARQIGEQGVTTGCGVQPVAVKAQSYSERHEENLEEGFLLRKI